MNIKNFKRTGLLAIFSFFVLTTPTLAAPDIDLDGRADGYDSYLETLLAGRKPNAILAPIRNFTLNADGHNIDQMVSPVEAFFYENDAEGNVQTVWKTKYQKKGQYRSQCDPPMFNLSFDKFDGQGRPKPLFPGWATAPATTSPLEYQEVRVVEKCDNTHGVLLNGNVVTQLVESSIFKIMRSIEVPAIDVVAFGKLNFVNAEPKYNGKTYNYTFLQRDNEEDDQISFSKQFGFKLPIVQATERQLWQPTGGNRLKGPTILDVANNKTFHVSLDPENSLKTLLMFGFFQDTDKVNMHNEDYGQSISDGKWRRIPYGFDLALQSCNPHSPENIIDGYILNLPESERQMYYEKLAEVAFDVFGKRENLYKMLYSVDRYPFLPLGNVQKNKLKTYYRLAFYEYADYFKNGKFTQKTGVSVHPRFEQPSYIFADMADYDRTKNRFLSSICVYPNPLDPPPVSLSQESGGGEVVVSERLELGSDRDGNNPIYGYRADTTINISIRSDSQDIEFPKNSAINFSIKNQDNESVGGAYAYYDKPEGMEEGVGVYVLPRGVSAIMRARVSGYIYEPKHIGKFRFVSDSLWLGRGFRSSPLNDVIKSEEFSISIPACVANGVVGSALNRPFTVPLHTTVVADGLEKPGGGGIRRTPGIIIPANVAAGSTHSLRWNPVDGSAPFNVYLKSSGGFSEEIGRTSNPILEWKVPDTVGERSYYIEVSSVPCPSLVARSNNFQISGTRLPQGGSATIDSITHFLRLGPKGDQRELALLTSARLTITAVNAGMRIDKHSMGGFNTMDVGNQMGSQYIYSNAEVVSVTGALSEDANGFLLPAGQPVQVVVEGSFNPNQMFAGAYTTHIGKLTLIDSSDKKRDVTFIQKQTEPIPIIGERAPYIQKHLSGRNAIDSFTFTGARFGAELRIRLLNFQNKQNYGITVQSTDSNNFSFIPQDFKIPNGRYVMAIESTEGLSNNVYFEIGSTKQAKKAGFMANVWGAVKKLLGF